MGTRAASLGALGLEVTLVNVTGHLLLPEVVAAWTLLALVQTLSACQGNNHSIG